MKNTKFEFEAIGTHWVIDINEEISAEKYGEIFLKIKERIDIFDKDYSRFREDSLVTKMSQEAGEFIMPEDFDLMISLYKKMYDVTGGLVTPLIGKVMEDAGYDAKYSLEQKTLNKPKKWIDVLEWQKPTLNLKFPALLDFGAGGKGYLVDIVSDILKAEGVESYCVDAGGDMRYRSSKNKILRVGLENPSDISQVIGVASLLNKSLCGSAGNRRVWGDFHHIINPETLTSPREILAVWVIAETTILSDILTTGLFFVPPATLLENFNFDYIIVYSDLTMEKSIGFEAEIFN